MTHSDTLPTRQPRYPDIKSCDAWIAQAALGDPGKACAAFHGLLDEIKDAPPQPAAYLQILERLRPPLLAALAELTRRFAGKPLPLGPAETAAFRQVSDLWLTLLGCYRHLLRDTLQASAAGSGASLRLPALRSIQCAAELIAANLLARREVSGEFWQWLHVAYAFAEEHRVDSGDSTRDACAASYVQVLLLALARPHALSQRDALWAHAWATRFARKVRVERSTAHAAAYAVDLGGGAAAAWHAALPPADTGNSALRYLDTDALAGSLRRRLRRLKAGDAPELLGLAVEDGPAVSSSAALTVLRALLHSWCAAPAVARFPRRAVPAAATPVEVAIGLAAAHAAVAGMPFNDEARNWEYTRRSPENIQTFQRPPATDVLAEPAQPERWDAIDESALGFLLQRRGPGARVAHRQLLALRPGNAPRFILAEVRRLIQGPGQSLMLGVHALPGMACACAARPASTDPTRPGAYSRTFLMPMTQGLAPSLVLPSGWFQRDRELELRLDEGVVRIRLESLLGRGCDYDQVHFSAAA